MSKAIDRVGEVFGELRVIKMERNSKGKRAWICRCSCGNITQPIVGGNLTSGNTTKCKNHPYVIDLTGNRYGKLTVVSYSHTEGKRVMWNVICDCGKEKCYRSDMLQNKFKSCGCNWKNSHNMIDDIVLYKTNWYNNYCAAKARATNINNPNYKHYDELIQGEKFQKEWLDNPMEFIKHIGEKPSPQHSIDRIDNTKGYVIGNVRWATNVEQSNNTRDRKQRLIDLTLQSKLLNERSEVVNPYIFNNRKVIYCFYNNTGECLYLGYSKDVSTIVMSHLTYKSTMKKEEINEIVKIDVAIIPDNSNEKEIKNFLVNMIKPKYVKQRYKEKYIEIPPLKFYPYLPKPLYTKYKR